MNRDVKHFAFGNQLMLLYGRAKLSQSEFASLVGFSSVALRKWESGESCPKAESLKRVIEILMSKGAFSEQTEAIQLWELANQRGLKVPFDSVWFREVMQIQSEMAKHVPSEVEHKESVSTPYIGTGFASVQLEQPESSLKECAPRPERETPAPMLAPDQGTPVRHNLPFPPNPFFTGRESELVLIAHLFEKNERIAITQPISISGLGGIGKTQLALEYAHRCYPGVYHSVFFVNAADKASLEAGYLSLAHLLQLPEKNEREVDHIVQAVKVWLEEHAHWLLILDNADDLELACSFLPTRPRGHILFTTRSQIVGNVATLIPVSAMSREEGLLFLLRRSGFLPPGTSGSTIASGIRSEAEVLVEMLSGHPLALDQAGAYIEETRDPNVSATSAPLCKYRQLYQQQSRHLLNSRGFLGGQHPESIARTIEICVKSACELYPGCADILSFCSLLHPDAIPEELLCQETALDLDLLHFNEAIVALRRYSLVKRDSEKEALSIHRLVQAVIRDTMESQTSRQWMARVVRAVNAAFPEAEFEQWSRCEQLLPHALLCATWVEREAVVPAEAGHLLRKAGNYLRERGQYSDAEPLHKLALAIHEQHLGAEHPDTARDLHNLALLYWNQGKYEQAEPLYLRALAIFEQHLGASHPRTATCLNGMGLLYWNQGKYEQAESLYLRALAIREQYLGAEHPETANCLNNLAILYWRQGKYEQAEPLYLRAIAIKEQCLGDEHPDTATSLNNLAILYRHQGKCEQAEPLYQRALAIQEQHLGASHPVTAGTLHNLAELYRKLGKYEQAEPLYLRVLQVREPYLGSSHPDTADSLYELAELYRQQGKYEQAEPFHRRALQVRKQYLGDSHPDTAESLHGLAQLCQHQGEHEQAEALYRRALHIRASRLGPDHPETENTRRAYAAFLRRTECDESATVLGTGDKP